MRDSLPPEFWRDLLALYQRFPVLFWRSGKTIKVRDHRSGKTVALEPRYRDTPQPWLSVLIHRKGDRAVAVVPQRVEDLWLLRSISLMVEMRKLGYDTRILPEDADRYAKIMQVDPSAFRDTLDQLSRNYPDADRELLLRGWPSYADRSIPAWKKACLQHLTPEQQRVLGDLEDRATLRMSPGEIKLLLESLVDPLLEASEESQDLRLRLQEQAQELAEAVTEADRLDLRNHPFVKEWIQIYRNIGDRKMLHRFWRVDPGLEKGVKKPRLFKIEKDDDDDDEARLMREVSRLLEYQTVSAAFRILKDRKLLPLTTRTGRIILNTRRAFARWVDCHPFLKG